MSGSPITQDYAIVKWTDNTETALHNVRYMGLTVSEGSAVSYGVNCAVVKGSPTDQIHYDQAIQISKIRINSQSLLTIKSNFFR